MKINCLFKNAKFADKVVSNDFHFSYRYMAALVLMNIICLQYCDVYNGVLSHLENNWFLLLCLFVNILQFCGIEVCTLQNFKTSAAYLCMADSFKHKTGIILASPTCRILELHLYTK